MPRLPNGDVIAFYKNPKTGKTERHMMSSVSYEEAITPRTVRIVNQGPERVARVDSEDTQNWSLEMPEGAGEIEDFANSEANFQVAPSTEGPPAIGTRPVAPLAPRRQPEPPAPPPSQPVKASDLREHHDKENDKKK